MTTVRFIGSGDAFGSGGRLQTCILVDDGDWRALLDCGATSLVGVKAAGIDPASIDVILISHLHGDHFGGLPFWLLDAQFNSRRTTKLRLFGPTGLEPRLRAAMDVLFPGSQRVFEVVDVDIGELRSGATTTVGPATVEVVDVDHACGAPPLALRLTTPGRTVVSYSGDTQWTDRLVDISAGADLFIVETYFFDKVVPWHLSYMTLAANLHRITARRVVATHMSSDVLDRLPELGITAAFDGMEIEL